VSIRPPAATAVPGIFSTWWPLAASWLLMGAELPAISGVVGRQAHAEIMLAAFGGVVFPIALLVESPIIMMLAASTSWSRDTASFKQLERFTTRAAIALTVLHALIAFTPLYTWVVVPLLDVPEAVQAPARLGLQIMVPWNWAIADRRFRQGALIRFGHRETIARGTVVRLAGTISAVAVLWAAGQSGIVIATGSVTFGVFVEAAFVWVRARVLLPGPLAAAAGQPRGPDRGPLLAFYMPLALTPMFILAAQPVVAAGIARMPLPLEGLAVWGPLGGLAFLARSVGIAFNEVVIAHADDPAAEATLRRFAWSWGLGCSATLAIVAGSPLGDMWFRDVIGLEPPLVALGVSALWLAVPLPLLTFLQSYWQGMLVHAHRTRAVTGSVIAFLVVMSALMVLGVMLGRWNGLLVAMIAFTTGNLAQTLWLRWKWRREGPTRPEQPDHGLDAPEPL
jgi:hypothetical protein